jgi:transcriptional regulator with XRE-family HTH domain
MLKQKDIAAAIGVSNQTISGWLGGRENIGRSTAIKLSEAFGRDPGFWMFGDLEEIKKVLFFAKPVLCPDSAPERSVCAG